jgi:aryl-alcohol dehydrogenase-like predicted oxidoreductase
VKRFDLPARRKLTKDAGSVEVDPRRPGVAIGHAFGVAGSRIGLGTWAIGGWMWGGTEEREAVRTVRVALDLGINLIDTAPVYGFGKSEELVGKPLPSTVVGIVS